MGGGDLLRPVFCYLEQGRSVGSGGFANAPESPDDANLEIHGVETQKMMRDACQQTLKLGRPLLAQLDG